MHCEAVENDSKRDPLSLSPAGKGGGGGRWGEGGGQINKMSMRVQRSEYGQLSASDDGVGKRFGYDDAGNLRICARFGCSAPSFFRIERMVFRLAGIAIITVASLHGSGSLAKSVPAFTNRDVGLQNVCPSAPPSPSPSTVFACSFGLQSVAACHGPACYGAGGPTLCGPSGFSNEAWLMALSNCAQPSWWPWFVVSVYGAWALVALPNPIVRFISHSPVHASVLAGGNGSVSRTSGVTRPMQAALLVHMLLTVSGLGCMAAGFVKPYWVLIAFSTAAAGVVHRMGVFGVTNPGLRFVFLASFGFIPLSMFVSVVLAQFWGFAPSESNQILEAYAIITTACFFTGAATAACVHHSPQGRRLHYAKTALVSLAALSLVSGFYPTSVPLGWIVWPLWLFWLTWSSLRLGITEASAPLVPSAGPGPLPGPGPGTGLSHRRPKD
jgi:hypothetical protein